MEENKIDFGEITVPSSWNDITLKKYQEIEAFYDESQDNFNVMDVLHIMIDKDIDYINSLPAEFLDIILDKLSFLTEKPDFGEPTNKITIDGELYTVHFENQLKVGEYIAADTILKNDKHNYAALLAILCRKDGELYDSKFENEVIEERIKLFEKQPVLKVMGLIQFFFSLIKSIFSNYPVIFEHRGSHKPHSGAYRDFAQKWGNIKTLYEVCDEKIEKVKEVYQEYLNDYFQFLSYRIEKYDAEEEEDKFQEQLRKSKKR